MSEVKIIKKRESILYGGFKPEGAPDFTTVDYVLLSDYEKLKAQLEKAEAALLLISAPHCDYRTFESETLERLIECITADTDCAREYFKEKEQV